MTEPYIKFSAAEQQEIEFLDMLGSSVTFGQLGSIKPLMELIKWEEQAACPSH